MNPDINKVVVTYGDIYYIPGGWVMPSHLVVHELVHTRQQGNNPDSWWDKYLSDVDFRLFQELEAYKEQYKFICKKLKDRNKQNLFLVDFARILSGPTYGNSITQKEAFERLRA